MPPVFHHDLFQTTDHTERENCRSCSCENDGAVGGEKTQVENRLASNSNRFKTRMAGRGTDGIPTCMKEDMHWMGCNHGVN